MGRNTVAEVVKDAPLRIKHLPINLSELAVGDLIMGPGGIELVTTGHSFEGPGEIETIALVGEEDDQGPILEVRRRSVSHYTSKPCLDKDSFDDPHAYSLIFRSDPRYDQYVKRIREAEQ